jgi:protein ImuA
LEPKTVADAIEARSSEALVRALRQRIDQVEGGRRPRQDAAVSSGCRALDRLLPERGFRRGTLVEWLAAGEASGVETLALVAAREACGKSRVLVVFDRARQFYPPAAVRLGIDPGDLILVQAANRADNTWAMDQTLRCPGVAVVLAWPDGLEGHDFRRLQLAAEEGGGLGLLVRPQDMQHEPSWADVRLLVEPLPMSASGHARRMRIRVLRCRGGTGGRAVEVEINDETHTLHSVSRLARDAVGRRAAGA